MSSYRKNVVFSNILGASVWSGSTELVEQSLQVYSIVPTEIESKALEVIDLKKNERSCLCLEFSDFTPLMLAVVSPH